MTKKLKPSSDPAYFEWEPNEGDDSANAEDFELWAGAGLSAEGIKDPIQRAEYAKFLEAYQTLNCHCKK